MTRPKDLSIPQTPERVDRSEQALGLDLGPAGATREVWHELVAIDIKRHQTPGGSFEYVAERLIKDERLRGCALSVMREILASCHEQDGEHSYLVRPRSEFSSDGLERRMRELAPGFTGRFLLASRHEILPRMPMMTDEQYDRAFLRLSEVLDGADASHVRQRVPLSLLFDVIPRASIAEFEMPARGVLTGHLVHRPRMGVLAELLAIAGGLCADGHPMAEKACTFVRLASKAPPLVVHNEDGLHLVFLCAD